MSDELNQPNEPNKKDNPTPKIIWLFCAFVPSIVAIVCLKMNGLGLFPLLIGLNIICSIASGFGLIRGIKNQFAAFFLGLFLVLFFFVANVSIAVFVGCSGMGGRIAP